jgi:hypothetical protein
MHNTARWLLLHVHHFTISKCVHKIISCKRKCWGTANSMCIYYFKTFFIMEFFKHYKKKETIITNSPVSTIKSQLLPTAHGWYYSTYTFWLHLVPRPRLILIQPWIYGCFTDEYFGTVPLKKKSGGGGECMAIILLSHLK